MYSSLIDAPVNTELVLIKITRPGVEEWLKHLGLFTGSRVVRHDEEFNFHPVRVRGLKGDVVIPAGLAMKIYVHLESGSKVPLTEMGKKDKGHVEIHSGGRYVHKSLDRLGLKQDSEVLFLRSLPHMDYITVIDRKERTRLSEGEAARIWGHYNSEAATQFYFARQNHSFKVKDIMGGPRVFEHLKTHGVTPGTFLVLETIEQAHVLHKPQSEPITISSPKGLRLYLTPEQAGSVIIRSKA